MTLDATALVHRVDAEEAAELIRVRAGPVQNHNGGIRVSQVIIAGRRSTGDGVKAARVHSMGGAACASDYRVFAFLIRSSVDDSADARAH